MTLISAIHDKSNFIVVSDRAISVPGTSGHVLLPSTNAPASKSNPVVGFNVKTIIIKDILCVALSGSVNQIEELVEELKDFFMHRKVSRQSLSEFFSEVSEKSDCSALFALCEETEEKYQIVVHPVGKWLMDNSRDSLNILSAGSGATEWTKEVLAGSAYLDESEVSTKFSLQKVLNHCLKFMLSERITANQLLDGWGGGFDLTYVHNGRFCRLENLAYAFYVIDVDNDQTLLTPIAVIHQRYHQGKVIIRHFIKEGFQNYIISEFGDKMEYREEEPDCIANEIISCIHIFKGSEHVTELGVLFWDLNPNAEPAFQTIHKNDKFGLQFRPIYYDKLNEAVKDFMK